MPTHSNMNQSKQQASIPPEQRPSGADPQRGAESGEPRKKDVTTNQPGEREEGGESRDSGDAAGS